MKQKLHILSLCLFVTFSVAQKNTKRDSLLTKLENTKGLSKIKALFLLSNQFKLNQPDTALLLAKEAVALNDSFKNDTVFATGLGLIAECYSSLAVFDSAVVYYNQAITYSEKIKSLQKLASYNNGLGLVFYQLGNISKSIAYLEKAAQIKLQQKDTLYFAAINGNIAGAYQRLGKFDEAIAKLRTSENILKNYNNTELLANLYNSIGSAYQLQNQHIDSVEYYYKKCINLITKPEDEFYCMAAYINIADLYNEKRMFDLSEFYLTKAYNLVNRLNRSAELITVYEIYANLYERKGDYAKAYELKKRQLNFKDSLFTVEKQKFAEELETKYQAGKKDLKIKEQEVLLQKSINKRNTLLFSVLILTLVVIILIGVYVVRKKNQSIIEAAKQKFFANVVHEIRSPLTTIQAPLQLLKQNKTNEKDIANILMAERSVNRLNDLINQMLTINKIDSNTYLLNENYGDLELFLNQLIDTYTLGAEQKGITLIKQFDFEQNLVYFDKDVIQKIIDNLMNNAIKYSGNGKVVGVNASLRENENAFSLNISVWDNGIGISENDQEKIFERFYRTKNSRTQSGAGIGLSLVKELVALYKGKIYVQSEVGKGSHFFVEMLFNKTNDGVKLIKNFDDDKPTLLVIEDDAEILNFNTTLLQSNYNILKANNGLDAKLILDKTLPDLVLCDLMMPQMNGKEFVQWIKNHTNTAHIPVIVLSSLSSPNTKLELLNLGAQAYVTKPFIPDELTAIIHNQLDLVKKTQENYQQKLKQKDQTTEERFKGEDPYTQKLISFIFSNLDAPELTVEYLADLMATNRSHFQRKTKALTGYSPSELIKMIRLEKAKDYLLAKKGNITEVAYMVGFSSQSYFTKCFTDYFKKSPSEMLQNH